MLIKHFWCSFWVCKFLLSMTTEKKATVTSHRVFHKDYPVLLILVQDPVEWLLEQVFSRAIQVNWTYKRMNRTPSLWGCAPGLDKGDNIYYTFLHDLNDGIECTSIKFAHGAKFKVMADLFRRILKSRGNWHISILMKSSKRPACNDVEPHPGEQVEG